MKAIYARQSVDRPDSISIESQVEFCKYELRGDPFRLYTDKGYSGKNTDRPQFQRLLRDIEAGEISQVVVYKLDRISRSILDFSNMMELFERHRVEFVSTTEKFDTSSPMGRAMLNICIVFAQLERETIQKRVSDAYASRSKRGFYMGGRVPYGYRLAETEINGARTSKYEAEPEEAEQVRLIYRLYAQPLATLGDVARQLRDAGAVHRRTGCWDRSRLGELVKNPIYVRADREVYAFFQEQGAILCSPPEAFDGKNGCYLYRGRDAGRKTQSLAGQQVVLAPHEGLVEADVWLRARRKCLGNRRAGNPVKANNTWLAGKVKCGRCGYALTVKKSDTRVGRYFICSRRMQAKDCAGAGTLYAGELEELILAEMKRKLEGDFPELRGRRSSPADPRAAALEARLRRTREEIEALLDRVPSANGALMEYLGARVEALDGERRELQEQLKNLAAHADETESGCIRDYLRFWDALTFEEKRLLTDALIETVHAAEDGVRIVWRA